MPPYYPDQYKDGFSDQPYYPNYGQLPPPQQAYNQYVQQQPPPRVQVNVPQIQYQHYPSHQPPLPPPAQFQYPQSPQQYNTGTVNPSQYYPQQQQAYAYNNHFQQQYQPQSQPQPQPRPPSPVRVIVPPSSTQYQQGLQNQPPRESTQDQVREAVPKMPQLNLPFPQTSSRVLQEQPNMAKVPVDSTSKPIAKPDTAPNRASKELSPAHPSIILTLADEYIDAARKLEERTEDYHILMSTALGCLQVTLKTLKLSPIRNAQVSLKYAQLLYDETDDLDDAEIVLTKSIDLCERMKFLDLKYTMQLLLIKVLFRSKPKAAMRDLESMIQDIETYKHTAWEYPFRLQAVFFLLESRSHHSVHDALQHLEKIQSVANTHADRAVYTFAAILESLLHLRNPGLDSLTHSQQALAKARSYQLNPDVEAHPQMSVMMEFIDLMWILNTAANPDVVDKKRTNLKEALYASLDGEGWAKDETTWLRINSKSLKGIPTQVGGLIHDQNGRYYMVLSWLGKREFESLGFLLTGVALTPQNHYSHGKAEKFIAEGQKIIGDDIFADGSILTIRGGKKIRRDRILSIYFLAELAFMCANKGKWDKTREAVKSMDSQLKLLNNDVPDDLRALQSYLNGCVAQGNGDLDLALKHFQSQYLILRPQSASTPGSKPQKPSTNHTLLDLQILATINTALIIRVPSHPQHNHLDRLLNQLSAYFPNTNAQPGTPRPAISSNTPPVHPFLSPTHSLLLATLPNTTILQTKTLLAAALQSARRVSSLQVMSLCLTLMYDRFFRGGIQDVQAVKCAKAADHHVRTKVGSPLWGVMTGILEAESMELVGESADVVRDKRDMVAKVWESVPEGVRKAIKQE